MNSGALSNLIAHLSRLPGVGERTATRLAFHLLRSKAGFRQGLVSAIENLSRIRLCSVCATVTEEDPCSICQSHVRNQDLLCVVEKPSDIVAIERLQVFHGTYHVLHGLLSPMEGITPDDLSLPRLYKRAQEGGFKEVILALSPTVEGDATAAYLVKLLTPLGLQISRLASGLPVGGELEFADQITLGKAFEARTMLL